MSSAAPYILDVDTGIDDAVALALAVSSPEIELLAVTTLAGNVDIAQTTENTRRVLAMLGAGQVPVHRGASRPLARPHQDAAHVHGGNGLGNVELPPATGEQGKDRGPAAIIRMALARPGEITLVCVGPLTNLAIALNVEPTITTLLKRVVIMGGAFFNPGNITPFAEFNVFVDPEAAEQVFSAPFPDVTVVGLDASHQATLTRDDWERAKESNAPAAQLLGLVYGRSFTERGGSHFYLHDPLAVAIAIEPDLARYETGRVSVALDGERRGQTTFSEGGTGARIAKVIEVDRFHVRFRERMGLR
jgi:purine nucleosidase